MNKVLIAALCLLVASQGIQAQGGFFFNIIQSTRVMYSSWAVNRGPLSRPAAKTLKLPLANLTVNVSKKKLF
jgi:hypothetical protein